MPLKRISKEYQRSEERNRLLLESTSDETYAIILEGICTIWNQAAAGILNYILPANLIGKQTHSLFHHPHINAENHPKQECALMNISRA